MKRKLSFFAAFSLLLSLVACVEEDFSAPAPDDGAKLPIQLFNSIEQVSITRVNDEGFCDGDGVGIYVVNYNDGQPGTLKLSGNQADNVKFVYDEASGRWIPENEIYFRDKRTHVDIIGYYPYSSPTSVDAYPFEVAKDQSVEAANGLLGGYEASDFLWGKAADITPTASRIPLNFRHRMAGVVVSLAEGEGFAEGEFATLEQSVLVTNTIRKATIDLNTGEVTPVGDLPTTGTVPYRRESDFRAIVVPQTVAGGTPLFSLTVDGTPYVFRKNDDFTYTAGKLHKFTITVSKKGSSGLAFELLNESITAWEADNVSHDATAREYIVIDCPTPGTLKECIVAAGKDITKVKNLKVTGTIDQRDFAMMRDEMTALQSINLQLVKIAAYNIYSANEIPGDAFQNKSSLIRFVFPNSITKIGDNVFLGTNLSGTLIIPNGVTEIGFHAFSGCSGLTGTLTLPKSLVKIESSAFSGCSGLIGTLDLPASLREIWNFAFSHCSGLTGPLQLPEELEVLGKAAFYCCSGFTGDLIIPHKIKKIEGLVFNQCSGLKGILTLHNGITEIGDGAFKSCGFRGELVLPDQLLIIEKEAFGYTSFGGTLKLPATLTIIKDGAFAECKRLTGVVELPEELISIAPGTFRDCSQLEGVVIPKNVESIRENAFLFCYQLNSITCHAKNPPHLSTSAFVGVAKDNFTVEVPETAVANYSTAPGWNEFKRFAAHRDFSISRNLFRALNASLSKTLVLRAPSGEAWSVESAPEWVTVSPASGTGKTEVTITANEQAQGAGYREGEVVFLLDGKDYRSRTRVEQYDYTHSDGDVITVQSATRGAGVDLVFMGDCFDAKDISEGKYLDGVNEAIDYFFAVEPYKSYRDYFNVYIVFGLSPDSGIGTVNTIREAKFGSQYTLQAGLAPDQATCFEYACKAPTVTEDKLCRTLITLVENSEIYDGICYMYGDGSAIALCPMSRDVYPYDYRGIVQHEAGGHGFGKLGDEYIYHNAFAQACPICNDVTPSIRENKARGWYKNLSLTGNMYEVDWSHLIFDPMYSNLVDIYEGGYMHMRGVFRSEPNSCMNNNIPYYSAISREAIVKRIKEYAGETYSFEEFKANDVLDASTAGVDTRSFSNALLYPAPRNQKAPVYMGEKPMLNRK